MRTLFVRLIRLSLTHTLSGRVRFELGSWNRLVKLLPTLAGLAVWLSLPACTLDNPEPDLPLAVAPGYEVVYIPKEPRAPALWDRDEEKRFDEDTYVPPPEGLFPEGQAVDPLFGSPLFGGADDEPEESDG